MTALSVARIVTPTDVWRTWTLDPVVLAGLIVVALVYGAGVRALWGPGRPGRGIEPWRVWVFGAGLASLAVALVSPLDGLADALLSAHMVQHLVLTVVAPPMLVLGRPAVAAAAARPGWRRAAIRAARRPMPRRIVGLVGHPVVVWVLAPVALWGWHLPPLYDLAVRDDAVHALEHASFLGTAVLFWWTALQPSGRRRLARGADVLFVATGALQGAVLGALITFASTPLFAPYAVSSASWGVSPLQDQQWAGAVMWIPSGFVHLGIAATLFVRWLTWMDRDAARREARMPRFVAPRPGSLTASSEGGRSP